MLTRFSLNDSNDSSARPPGNEAFSGLNGLTSGVSAVVIVDIVSVPRWAGEEW